MAERHAMRRFAFENVLWRVGRKVGRTIYAQLGDEPSDDDVLIGVMDKKSLALLAVEGHNARLSPQEDSPPEGEKG